MTLLFCGVSLVARGAIDATRLGVASSIVDAGQHIKITWDLS